MSAATEQPRPAVTRIDRTALEQWASAVLVHLGVREGDARTTAASLVDASVRGVDSHGVARLPAYVRLIDLGFLDLHAEPRVVQEFGGTAMIDAGNGLGQPAGTFGMQTAITLAEQHGIGWVSVRDSNHFGTVGYYLRQATDRGFLALGGTNSASVVAPTRASQRFMGTNPMGFGAPVADGPPVILDMSTSGVAGGKLEVAMRAGADVPLGWGLTASGEPTSDPAAILPAGGALTPLGGTEEHSSYKGYGLGLMVEALTGVLGGGLFAGDVGPLTSSTPTRAAGVSHFFVALDPRRFGEPEEFTLRMTELCQRLRGLTPTDPEKPVLIPGDPENVALAQRQRDGVPLDDQVVAALGVLAERTGIALPRIGDAADPSAIHPLSGSAHPIDAHHGHGG